MNVVLTIAGSDSGGGAGIQADLKTFEAHGLFGTTVITAITAQNTLGVRGVLEVPAEMVVAQIEAVCDDFPIAGVKVGMLSGIETVRGVAAQLRSRISGLPIVVDPVMVSTSGTRLLQPDAVEALCCDLLPLATLVTPNRDEASILAGIDVCDADSMRRAAELISAMGPGAVLIKGGHMEPRAVHNGSPAELTDLLFDGRDYHFMTSRFIATTSTHGTGCTLSSAITANLVLGMSLVESVQAARDYLHNAIRTAPGLGAGHGPLRHRPESGPPHGVRTGTSPLLPEDDILSSS
jgi:hydroxymethylpyrimidine/phosphomethylpyrimidine kinase